MIQMWDYCVTNTTGFDAKPTPIWLLMIITTPLIISLFF